MESSKPPELRELYEPAETDDRLYRTIHRAVTDALEQHERNVEHHRNHAVDVILVLLFLWSLFLASDYFSYAPWINRLRYSLWYRMDKSQIVQYEDEPPSDCNFLKSPIGSKGCYYQKHVDLEAASPDHGGKPTIVVYWTREQRTY
jgi:hypothetical protein